MSETTSKVWTKARIQQLIATNEAALYRALIRIYERQTASEQSSEATKEHNGVGFTAFDAEFLTSCAKFLRRTGFLTAAQRAKAAPKMKKYWRQLLDIAKSQGHEVSYK